MHKDWYNATREQLIEQLEMESELKKEYMRITDCLKETGRDFCCSLNEDGTMNEEAFKHLCDLAMYVGCTHLPWWNKD